MIFYLLHKLNWNVLKPEGKSEGTVNTRTFMIGFAIYTVAFFTMLLYQTPFRELLWWVLAADSLTLAVIYKNYYKKSSIDAMLNSIGMNSLSNLKHDGEPFDPPVGKERPADAILRQSLERLPKRNVAEQQLLDLLNAEIK